MKSTRTFTLLAFALLAGLILTGCSSDTSATPTTPISKTSDAAGGTSTKSGAVPDMKDAPAPTGAKTGTNGGMKQ